MPLNAPIANCYSLQAPLNTYDKDITMCKVPKEALFFPFFPINNSLDYEK